MHRHEAEEIIACLPRGRTLFDYYRDRYAVELLRWRCGRGVAVSELKRDRLAPLLRREPVRRVLASCGDGRLRPEALREPTDRRRFHFRLSLGTWGPDDGGWLRRRRRDWWYQTTRQGWSLVLRLDLANDHDRALRRLLRPEGEMPGRIAYHPVNERATTLAWVRLDVDLTRREALIEELQNDWLRDVAWALERLRRRRIADPEPISFLDGTAIRTTAGRLRTYAEEVLGPYRDIWDEATLFAALWFCRCELGLRTVYYHTHRWGTRLKNMEEDWGPPRSLYDRLPRRLAFDRSRGWPRFLAEDHRFRRVRRALGEPEFFVHRF